MREGDSSIKPQTCLGITKSKNGVRCAIPWMSLGRQNRKRDDDGDESHGGEDPEVKFV